VIWGEETPKNLEYIEKIFSFYPNVRFVHIIRDPKAVSLSLSKTSWAKRRSHYENSRRWKRYIKIADNFIIKHPDSIIEIKYEDLIKNTENTLLKICEFLKIKYEKRMFNCYTFSDEYLSSDEPWKDNCKKQLFSTSIEKWKDELNKNIIKMIDLLCYNELISKGYTPTIKYSLFRYFFLLPYTINFIRVKIIKRIRI